VKTIEGRGAVVIGGGSGIGRGISLGLAAAGARVVVADIGRESADSVVKEIGQAGGEALAAQVDGTERSSLAGLADLAERELSGIHILSNNVGVHVDRRLDAATEADWAWVIDLNLMSIVRGVDVFLPRLRSHGEEAHIVNTASMAALIATTTRDVPTHLGLYTATKHAILGYTETLRGELAPEGIGVSVLCPGMVLSNLAQTSARHRPERHGGPLPAPPAIEARFAKMMLPAEAVGPIVVRGIRANRLHILTHPEARVVVEKRMQQLLADFDFAAAGEDEQ
jgi:NAD(P)-dependent dehydrogenase (short-subunit alcohol dehydrogenase family)